MFDLARNISAQFTFQPGFDGFPIWSRDGKTIVYTRGQLFGEVIVERPANGVGPEKVLADETGKVVVPTDISKDGRWLVLAEPAVLNGTILLRSREDAKKIIPIQERDTERDGSISPDGLWLLYSRDAEQNVTCAPTFLVWNSLTKFRTTDKRRRSGWRPMPRKWSRARFRQ